VFNRRLASRRVERGGFKQHIRFGAFEPFVNVAGRLQTRGKMTVYGGDGIKTVSIREPTDAATRAFP